MQDLHQKLEAAAGRLIENAGTGVNVQLGLSHLTKALPSATVAVSNGSESPIGSGNFILTLAVEIRSNAANTTLAAHRNYCTATLAPMMSDDLANELTTQGSEALTVFGITNRQTRQTVEETAFVTELSMDVVCCGIQQ